MTMPTDTARFRFLLRRFYDGSATLAEEQELTGIAANADITSPAYADLRADIALLRDLNTSAADARAFANAIDSVTVASPGRAGRFRRRWLAAACSAAAACVALAVTFAAMRHAATPDSDPARPSVAKQQIASSQSVVIRSAPSAMATQPHRDTPYEIVAKAETAPAPAQTHSAAATDRNKSGLAGTTEAAEKPDGGQELEMAAETVDKSIALLTDNLAATQQSLILTQEILTKVGNNLKNIL